MNVRRCLAVSAALTLALATVSCGSPDSTTEWGGGGPGAGGSTGSSNATSSSGSGSGASGSGSSGSSGAGSGGGSGSSSGAGTGSGSGSSGGAGSGSGSGSSGGGSGSGSSSSSGGGSGSSSGSGSSGGPITCPGPGNYTMNGGSCGTERWDIKTGTDSQAASLSLVPQPNTIAQLVSLPAAGGGSSRESPTETTLWELKDVTLTELKLETDSDYHMVLSDGTHTMIAEIPYPSCATGSPWSCFMGRARSIIDAKYNVTSSPQYPAQTVTVRGIGFFDYIHGQTGVAPNGIELHPVLQICFGQGCTPS